jgi:hypothetical protein
MLLKNPLHPPGPPRIESRASVAGHRPAVPFVSPEDFDVTGVLAGMDCSESRYWWVPELHTDPAAADSTRFAARAGEDRRQAAERAADRSSAAA